MINMGFLPTMEDMRPNMDSARTHPDPQELIAAANTIFKESYVAAIELFNNALLLCNDGSYSHIRCCGNIALCHMRLAKGVDNRQYTTQERWCIACSYARMAILMAKELLKQILETKGVHHMQVTKHLPDVHPDAEQSKNRKFGIGLEL